MKYQVGLYKKYYFTFFPPRQLNFSQICSFHLSCVYIYFSLFNSFILYLFSRLSLEDKFALRSVFFPSIAFPIPKRKKMKLCTKVSQQIPSLLFNIFSYTNLAYHWPAYPIGPRDFSYSPLILDIVKIFQWLSDDVRAR